MSPFFQPGDFTLVLGATVGEPISIKSENIDVNLLAGAEDVDEGDTLTVTNLTLTSGDASGITENGNELQVNPNAYNSVAEGNSEVITYSYDISDGIDTVQQTATITITGESDPTDAVDDNITTDEDTIFNGNVRDDNGNGADSGDNLTITAVNGDDTIYGGKDNDSIMGENGHDLLLGNKGDDTIKT